MTKNIIVVDEQGNDYGATWPKRAKGLVKQGRARFVEENKICLACPPNMKKTEDNIMTEKTNNMTVEVNENMANNKKTANTAPQYTIEYILAAIEKIHAQTKHLDLAMAELANVRSGGPGDVGAQGKAQAIAEVVRCRETTNQQILKMYEKMYDNLTK